MNSGVFRAMLSAQIEPVQMDNDLKHIANSNQDFLRQNSLIFCTGPFLLKVAVKGKSS